MSNRVRHLKRYVALTIIKRGKLSKSHIADPKLGLDIESKKAQEEPVNITLTPIKSMPISTDKLLSEDRIDFQVKQIVSEFDQIPEDSTENKTLGEVNGNE